MLACRLRHDDAVGGRLPGRPVRISLKAGGERTIEIWLRSLEAESRVRACVRSSRAPIGRISWRRHRRKPKALGAIAPFGVLIQPAADRRRSSRRTQHSTRAGARPVGCCVHSSAARVVRPYPRTFIRPGRWRDPVAGHREGRRVLLPDVRRIATAKAVQCAPQSACLNAAEIAPPPGVLSCRIASSSVEAARASLT